MSPKLFDFEKLSQSLLRRVAIFEDFDSVEVGSVEGMERLYHVHFLIGLFFDGSLVVTWDVNGESSKHGKVKVSRKIVQFFKTFFLKVILQTAGNPKVKSLSQSRDKLRSNVSVALCLQNLIGNHFFYLRNIQLKALCALCNLIGNVLKCEANLVFVIATFDNSVVVFQNLVERNQLRIRKVSIDQHQKTVKNFEQIGLGH